ncbi:hypothetical protein MRB53_032778 [Persea americana]|uniref:Uncharacterized protein n=1 Tax=Persea americana TaxID=3435 RepID=A0ACC2KTF1_PERAE|nr:hypothetical protein MRB53_032778 [Persea americana]
MMRCSSSIVSRLGIQAGENMVTSYRFQLGFPGGGQARSTEEKRENSPGYRNNMDTLLIINPACSSPGAANAFRFSFSR